MKFDYCIGNPPYQKENSHGQLWPDFINSTVLISNKSLFIHPAAWVIPKKNMVKYRDLMVENGLKFFRLYQDHNDIFPDVRRLEGGVSITLFEKDYVGKINYVLNNENDIHTYEYENVVTCIDDFENECYHKVFKNIDTNCNMLSRMLGSATAPVPGYDKFTMLPYVQDTPDNLKEPIQVYTNNQLKQATGKYIWGYIEKSKLQNYPDKLFSSRKILLGIWGEPKNPKGPSCIIGKGPWIVDKYMIGGMLQFVYPEHDNDRELQLIKSLFMTKTARYLMAIKMRGLRVIGFECIPDYLELAKLLPEDELFTDEWFYKTFDFSEGLINEIETRVSPKVDKEA